MKKTVPQTISLKVLLTNDQCGGLLGLRGENKREIEKNTGVSLVISKFYEEQTIQDRYRIREMQKHFPFRSTGSRMQVFINIYNIQTLLLSKETRISTLSQAQNHSNASLGLTNSHPSYTLSYLETVKLVSLIVSQSYEKLHYRAVIISGTILLLNLFLLYLLYLICEWDYTFLFFLQT